jgi:hypothetical protein
VESSPVIVSECNASFQLAQLLINSKQAIIHPLLKKQMLDSNDQNTY